MKIEKERIDVVRYSKLLVQRGLTRGTGGNISVFNRGEGLVAITPSAVEYADMSPEDVAVLTLEGTQVEGNYAPSSETGMHLACYQKRSGVGAVVHTHSLYATVLACLHETIPPVHYLIGFAGGSVKCIPYYLYGTPQLAQAAAMGLEDKNAILLGNHGLLCVGADLDHAFNVAEETEFVAEVYCTAKRMGAPQMLTDGEMKDVLARFERYRKSHVSQIEEGVG